MQKQLCFFEESLEIKIEKRVKDIEEKHLKVSRSQYAKIAELLKIIIELKGRIDTMESALANCGLEISINNGQVTFHSIKLKSA